MKTFLLCLLTLIISFFAFGESAYSKSERARVLYEKGEAGEAAKIYKELVRSRKNREVKAVLQFNLGTALLRAADFAGAVDAFYAGLGAIPRNLKPGMQYNLAHALFKAGRRDESLTNLRELILLNPDFEEAKLLYEWILLQKPSEPPPPENNQEPPPPPPPMLEELPPPPPDMLQDEMELNPDSTMKPW